MQRGYFSKTEKLLWTFSTAAIIAAFFACGRGSYLQLLASLVGVTSLILNAKGHPAGQALMLLFSALYGIISYRDNNTLSKCPIFLVFQGIWGVSFYLPEANPH